MKKEVSDHIARVFLETRIPEKKSENKEEANRSLIFFVVVSAAVIASLILGLNMISQTAMRQTKAARHSLSLEKHDGPYSLNFNFTDAPSKIETLSIAMEGTDLKGFTRMRFAIRLNGVEPKSLGSIKVSLTNARRETSSLYLSDIHHSWKTVELSLKDFTQINDWTRLERVSFTLEAWNAAPLKGELLIDGVEFINS
jgi:hypothetical protein